MKLKSWKVFTILFEIFLGISASTHWVVTENGRIQSQLDSAFHLRRPYDLLALLEQEHRVRSIETLYQDLVARKAAIDWRWSTQEGATDLEARLYSQDEDCMRAGKPLSDTDLYNSLAGNLEERICLEQYLPADISDSDPEEPDCSQTEPLPFSMHTFEHLYAMSSRSNLSSAPEPSLLLIEGSQFGRQVATGLGRNKTSWLHHHLASLYWRLHGDPFRAVECARKAIVLSPREHRDLPLLSLGSIFHQARFPADAAIVLHAAVDHEPLIPSSHFMLGCVYAVLGDYNRSVACYDNAIRLRPDWEQAVRTKHSVLCHCKLERGLQDLHESLQNILAELHDFHSKQEQWLKHQERLIWEQAPLELRLLGQDEGTLSAMLRDRGQSCTQKIHEGRPVLSCDMNSDSQLLAQRLQIDITLSLQMLLNNVESQAKLISEQMSRRSQQRPLRPPSQASPVPPPPPATMLHHEKEGWPTAEECQTFAAQFPDPRNSPPVFLGPESRGFEIHSYLGELISLGPLEDHPLPWHPPLCNTPLEEQPTAPYLPAGGLRDAQLAPDDRLRAKLLEYVGAGRTVEAEVGQRVMTAMGRGVGPSWLLHTLASLYWRVRGHAGHALDCLATALDAVPNDMRDIVLVSLGSVLHQVGHYEGTERTAREALEIRSEEPSTHFLLASALGVLGNSSGAAHHIRQALAAEPRYYDGILVSYLRAAVCKEKFGSGEGSESPTEDTEEMCGASSTTPARAQDLLSSVEGLREGDTLLCSPDGSQCRAVQCYSAARDTSGMVTLEPATVCGGGGSGSGSSSESTDEGELERVADEMSIPKVLQNDFAQFHLRISLGEDGSLKSVPPLGDFYVPVSLTDDPLPDSWLHGRGQTETYPLSPGECERIRAIDWTQLAAEWFEASVRYVSVNEQLPPLPRNYRDVQPPMCDCTLPVAPPSLDQLLALRLRQRMPLIAETGLVEGLQVMVGVRDGSTQELGLRIALALQENTTSWVLATAAALYWRVVGQADQAIMCLRQALQYAPSADRDIPLVGLSNVLHRAGFYSDALAIATMALEVAPRFEVTHFTVANIHTSLGDLEKAISFYRSSLALQPHFEPARNRLQSILCSLLFEDHAIKTGP